MVASIPASAIVSVIPNVIDAGGSGLDLVGLALTNSNRVPTGTVQSFASASDVTAFFGNGSLESQSAAIYFNGFENANTRPAAMLFAQYPATAVPAYLRGGKINSLTLAQLQAITPGVMTITANGIVKTSASINLSSATSFSNAAALIQTAFNATDVSFTGAIASTTLTVSAVASGTLAVGQVIAGTGVTVGTVITALGTGTGGTGTYTVSPSQTAASTAMTGGPITVTYDSVSGGLIITDGTPGPTSVLSFAGGTIATSLFLTAATGAVQSLGAAAGVPDTNMDALVAQTQNFATFTTLFEPNTAAKIAFAQWTDAQDDRFAYIMWDTDITVTTNANTASAGYAIVQAGYEGTFPIYVLAAPDKASFVMGAIASIDFTQLEGRTTLAFRSQSGQVADVTNETIGNQLIANSYNFYGAYATANDRFTFLYPGSVTGEFAWLDSYINQIWMNNAFQLALMTLLTDLKSVPYNNAGYALIEAAMADVVDAALNFGAIRGGVPLSNLQAAQVNTAAGLNISDTLTQRGWYIQVLPASAIVRAARGSPPTTFWYCDGQSVQKINLASVQVQ